MERGEPSPEPTGLAAATSPVTTAGSTKLLRLVRSELDLTFYPPAERALLQVAHASKRIGRRATSIGLGFFGVALGTAMVPVLSLVAPALALIGVGFWFVGAAGSVLSVGSRLPALVLKALRLLRKPTREEAPMVTITGRVRALRTLPSLDGQPVVFTFVRATREGRGAHVYKAEEFFIDDLPEGPILVEVTWADFLGEPALPFPGRPGLPAEILDLLPAGAGPIDVAEATLRAGDRVEATGFLEERVDPAGERTGGRDTPMARVLRGTPKLPLRLRHAPSAIVIRR